jgi:hypothetical protein
LTVTTPYVLLTDCTDVFFVAPASALVSKLQRLGGAVIGGEIHLYYPQGEHDTNTVRDWFQARAQLANAVPTTAPQAYPNSGIIAGETAVLRDLLGAVQRYKDDQAACIDAIYTGITTMTVDYRTVVGGNIPKYKNEEGEDQFVVTPGRVVNRYSGEEPVVIHFPGKNWNAMDRVWNAVFPNGETNDETGSRCLLC